MRDVNPEMISANRARHALAVDVGRPDRLLAALLPDPAVTSTPLVPLGRSRATSAVREHVLSGRLRIVLPEDATVADTLLLDGDALARAGHPALPVTAAAMVVVGQRPPENWLTRTVPPDAVQLLPAAASTEQIRRALELPSRPPTPGRRRRVLFVSSNGSGMGHLTRILALARRAGPDTDASVLSLSQAVGVVGGYGLPYDYLPSRTALGIGPRTWNTSFTRRFAAAVDRAEPDAVVFDGSYPYDGLLRTKLAGTAYVWSRRPMWQQGRGAAQLGRGRFFDLILEPGELAAGRDRGPTVGRGDATPVRPVVLLEDEEVLPAEQARDELGLDSTRPAALVTLGAGTLNDLAGEVGAVTHGLASDDRTQICVTAAAIATGDAVPAELADRLTVLRTYPVSRYARAFDFAVAAAGYNSFHESIAFATPTAFLPNRSTALDDQLGRAEWAAQAGVGVHLADVGETSVRSALEELRDPQRQRAMHRRCREVWPGNGAADAMAAVETLIGAARGGGTP